MSIVGSLQLAFPEAVYLVDIFTGGAPLIEACKRGLESPYVTKVCSASHLQGTRLSWLWTLVVPAFAQSPFVVAQNMVAGFALPQGPPL
jgi:hypothetical protein